MLSLFLSLGFLYFSSKAKNIRTKLWLIYLHILLFIVPLVIFAFSSTCVRIPVLSCNAEEFIGFTIGMGALSFGVGYFALPLLYLAINKKRLIKEKTLMVIIKKYSVVLNIKTPRLYYTESAKPVAYSLLSLKPSIFISVGLLEFLGKKEIEAVLLHELYHIKSKSPTYKFLALFAKNITPLRHFLDINKSLQEQEKDADNFAIKTQNTRKFINSAKKKIELFYDNF